MKNYYLTLGIILASFTTFGQNGQLENRGFESWTNHLVYESPNLWFNSNEFNYGTVSVTKSADAQLGSFSAECVAPGLDNGFGYLGFGELVAGPVGGIPYTADFTSVKFQYKSEFGPDDSLYVYVQRYLGGMIVGEYLGGAAYGNHSAWTEGTFTIPAGTQDEIFVAFLTGTPTGDYQNAPGSWFRIDNIQLFNGVTAAPAPPNFSLENWTSVMTEEVDYWYTLNPVTITFGTAGTVKTTDVHSGTYAAQLTTQYVDEFESSIPGLLTLSDPMGEENAGIPYTAMPTSFSGWYKFTPSVAGNDEPGVGITFFKEGNSIGEEQMSFSDANVYTEFTLPISLLEAPDSMSITFFSGENEGAVLKLDDLSLSGGTVGLNQFAKSGISVYPNPATDKVMIQAEGDYNWEIVTVSGNVVLTGASVSGAQEISLTGLNAGTYFVRLSGNAANETHKLIVR